MWTIILSLAFTATHSLTAMSEEKLLEMYGSMAFRPDPSTLCILTAGGDTVSFIDNEEPGIDEEYASYRLVDRVGEGGLWVVYRTGYEWEQWKLVDGVTGKIQTAISAPVVGPIFSRSL